MARFSVKIDVMQGNDTDYIVRTTLTKWVSDRAGLSFEPTNANTGNGANEWQLEGNLEQVAIVLATFQGLGYEDISSIAELFGQVTEVFDPDFVPDTN